MQIPKQYLGKAAANSTQISATFTKILARVTYFHEILLNPETRDIFL
jgi:hypothetical protein